ncbi:MAG: hypothetical protein HOH43_25900 [Candidatus Latescibacteria bacterium]|nr:hypothetical protein [Candidatus Latescibacterota bacterium]
MGRLLRLGLPVILILALSTPVAAQVSVTDSLHISARVDQERMTVGDALIYTIVVNSPPSAVVEWPDLTKTIGPFDVRSFEHDGPHAIDNGQFADTLRYALTVFEVGAHTIPPFELPYTLTVSARESDASRLAIADSLEIAVVSVIDDEATDIRDLKDPAELPDSIPWYVWVTSLGLMLALVAAAVYYYRRRGREEAVPEAPAAEARKPAHELAYEELASLAEKGLVDQGMVANHYTELSEIIRRYLSRRYQILAMEITTTELLEGLNDKDFRDTDRELLANLLGECDLVKFARYIPTKTLQHQTINRVQTLVTATKLVLDIPVPVEGPSEAVVSSSP